MTMNRRHLLRAVALLASGVLAGKLTAAVQSQSPKQTMVIVRSGFRHGLPIPNWLILADLTTFDRQADRDYLFQRIRAEMADLGVSEAEADQVITILSDSLDADGLINRFAPIGDGSLLIRLEESAGSLADGIRSEKLS